MAKKYCTKADIENYLLIDIDANFNNQIDSWIESASEHIRLSTNRDWLADSEASDRYFDGTGYQDLHIDDFIGTPTVAVGEDYGVNFTTITDFIVQPYNTENKHTIIRTGTNLPLGIKNMRVGAKWGYGEEVPQDIRHATTVFASAIVLAQTNQDGEIASEKIGNYQVTYKNDQHKDDFAQAMDIINNRRVYVL